MCCAVAPSTQARLWGCQRSEELIKEHMNEPMPYNTANLLGQWTFNEGAGELIVDSSGLALHSPFPCHCGAPN